MLIPLPYTDNYDERAYRQTTMVLWPWLVGCVVVVDTRKNRKRRRALSRARLLAGQGSVVASLASRRWMLAS